jgi:hypothetical protein
MGKTLRNVLRSIVIVGTLALPYGIDYLVNGPYEVSRVGEGLSQKVVHEYENKIVVGGWAFPWGSVWTDKGKDGSLDKVEYRGLSKFPAIVSFSKESFHLQRAQKEYSELLNNSIGEE